LFDTPCRQAGSSDERQGGATNDWAARRRPAHDAQSATDSARPIEGEIALSDGHHGARLPHRATARPR
ncbi:MAG: hypothetical protein ABI641_02070, partial [Caldimonas sp.]